MATNLYPNQDIAWRLRGWRQEFRELIPHQGYVSRQFNGFLHLWRGRVAKVAHRSRQVGWSYEHSFDALGSGYAIQIFQSFAGFDLNQCAYPIVRLLQIVWCHPIAAGAG